MASKPIVRMLTAGLTLLMLIVAVPLSTNGQIVTDQPTSGRAGITYTYWKISTDAGDATLSQTWLPMSVFLPIQENLEAQVFFSTTSSSIDTDIADARVTGLGDLRLQVSRSVMEDQVLLSLGMSLPTGKTELDLGAESELLQLLAESFLDVPSRRWGEGFGLNLLVGGAQHWQGWNLAASAAWWYSGAYTPYEGSGDYNPGDLLRLVARAQKPGDALSWSGGLSYTHYAADQVDGDKTFRQSPYLQTYVGADYRRNSMYMSNLIRYTLRGDNKLFVDDASSQTLKLYGNELQLLSRVVFDVAPDWYAGPTLSVRLIGGNDMGFDNSHTVRIGALVGKSLTEKHRLHAEARYMRGSADGGNISLSGLQLMLEFKAEL